jgi:uncharacterized membrane protein YidH (DUF202 family)
MNSVLRIVSVIAVMLVVGYGSSIIGTARLKKQGVEAATARKQAGQAAKKHSVIAAFLYMVFMVSLVSLFL